MTGNDIYIEFNYSVLFLCIYFYSYFLFLASIILFGSWVLYKKLIYISLSKKKKIHIEKKINTKYSQQCLDMATLVEWFLNGGSLGNTERRHSFNTKILSVAHRALHSLPLLVPQLVFSLTPFPPTPYTLSCLPAFAHVVPCA